MKSYGSPGGLFLAPSHILPGECTADVTRPDETLMEEVRAGNLAAFQVLYDRHHGVRQRVTYEFGAYALEPLGP